MPQEAPYGAWSSPVSPSLAAAGAVQVRYLATALDRQDVLWLEPRPQERGRNVIMRRGPDGSSRDVIPPPFNARTTAHEYGGGAFTAADGGVYFSHFNDQRLYRVDPDARPRPITPETTLRYADAVVDRWRERLVAVREDHRAGGREPANTLVSVNAEGDWDGGMVIASGADFYAAPRLSPDGRRLAWLCWNHPLMPWDGTELWVADVRADGTLGRRERVAGGSTESIMQPEWSPAGVLHFISDRTGWWNLYRWREGQAEPLAPLEAEFAGPAWAFGQSNYGFLSATEIVCVYMQQGMHYLARLDTATGALTPIETPFTEIMALRVGAGRAVFAAGSPTQPPSIVAWDAASGELSVLREVGSVEVDPAYISVPQAVEFPTEGGETAYGFYYPPTNPDYVAPAGEAPPLLVLTHGGPTGHTTTTFYPLVQFWTTRGFAVLDVNYRGSTGYGRAYRERLKGNWGVVEVDDCVNGALWLARQGLADENRLAIRGGSAGGYTTLSALTFRDVFKAGASHFGVSDVEALALETHKFEARYMDALVAPLSTGRDLMRARSPIHAVDRLACPVIFFQGLDDKVVPPNQAEKMVDALKRKGVPVAYVPFQGEGHGFRNAANIRRALEAELYFYARVFGIPLAEDIEPVPIANL